MNGESSTSKIPTPLAPSSSSKGISRKTASTSLTENVEISGHSLPAPGDVPRVHPSDEAVPSTKTASPIAFHRVQQKSAERRLCGACANLISVFDESVKTARDIDKEGASHINHHKSLISLLECSAVCPVCALIVNAVPCRLKWFLMGIVRDVVIEMDPLISDAVAQIMSLQEWKLYLDNPQSLLSQYWTVWYSNRTEEYLKRVRSLNLREDIPLTEVLSSIQEMGAGYFEKGTHVIRIKDQYAIKGQLGDFALFLQTDKRYVLQTISSGNLRIATSPNEGIANLVAGRLVATQGGTPESLNLAKEWIATCFQAHPECRWSTDDEDPPLPTRIIDVGGPDPGLVTLDLAGGKKGKWLALSHRWPRESEKILTLLKENFESFKAGIPLASLPATFQDAIKLTRFLDLRYLWIDSLCIIQNSVSDWECESANMPSIYQSAYVTVAAASTEESRGGIFVQRAWTQKSMAYSLPLKSGTLILDLPLSLGLEDEETNYLDKRAWCFQESRLSRRLLTFDRLQMSYTCLKHGLCESRIVPEAAAREERNSFLPRLYSASSPSQTQENTTKALTSTWYQAVTDYTSRSLTFPQDKLVAIAGMARIVGIFLNCSYHAGLWEENLPQALLWSPYEEETFPHLQHKSTRPAEYRAPSWSWASVESPISNFLCKQTLGRKTYAEIVSIVTTLQGPDLYGQVKDGCLTIKAPFLKAMVGNKSLQWPYQPDFVPIHVSIVGLAEYDEQGKYGHGIFDIEWPKIRTTVSLLRITQAYGLVLTQEKLDGPYQRIGVVHFVEKVEFLAISEFRIA